ncbi:MAG: hypothetical protein HY269_01145 [Deltaproteobacteria bacterium]|nr:hypothetical protein [Deltaproteobacteria bacterium]
MKVLPMVLTGLPDLEKGKRLLARVLRKRDTPEPVAAWRAVPEAALGTLTVEERGEYIHALLPLIRTGKTIDRPRLRRLYQLFTFLEMSAEARLDAISSLHTKLRLEPDRLPSFADSEVRLSLLTEAIAMAGKSPTSAAQDYLIRLRNQMGVKASEANRWMRFFESLTDLENRVASALGKRGHIVRVDDRKLEIFKKAVASVGIPGAVIFPLGTVGLSVEGISTGLVALGGGFLLPTGIAMVMGLGAAVALGITSKKILDMVWPTTDADRTSIDIEKLNADAARIRDVLDEAVADEGNRAKVEAARVEIARIIKGIVPLDDASRAKLEQAFAHARILGDRYLEYLSHDRAALERDNRIGADDLAGLLDLDAPVIR